MGQIVITCFSQKMYECFKEGVNSGGIMGLGKCNKNFLVDGRGYFYFEDNGENINRDDFLEAENSVSLLFDGSKLNISRVVY